MQISAVYTKCHSKTVQPLQRHEKTAETFNVKAKNILCALKVC